MEAIKISGISYKLKGIVYCNGAHFTCATQENNSWIYFNDLCDSLLIFPSLVQVYSHFPEGWFFGIYEISELPIDRVPHLDNSIPADDVHSNNQADCMDTSTVITDDTNLESPLGSTENFDSKELKKDQFSNQSENKERKKLFKEDKSHSSDNGKPSSNKSQQRQQRKRENYRKRQERLKQNKISWEEHLPIRKECYRKMRKKLKQNKKRWQERVTKQSENYYQRSNLMVSCHSRQRCLDNPTR